MPHPTIHSTVITPVNFHNHMKILKIRKKKNHDEIATLFRSVVLKEVVYNSIIEHIDEIVINCNDLTQQQKQ